MTFLPNIYEGQLVQPKGFHNKIKVLKRISYELKSFEEYRKRILFICNEIAIEIK